MDWVTHLIGVDCDKKFRGVYSVGTFEDLDWLFLSDDFCRFCRSFIDLYGISGSLS